MRFLAHQNTLNSIGNFVNSPSHALALAGESGAGKGYTARYIASQVLGIKNAENYPYLKSLDIRGDKAGISDIRDLQSNLVNIVPGEKPFRRVVIIENLGYLGHEGQNALLKTLEEPPEDTLIIVTYSNQEKVLLTIRSRTQQIRILPVSEAQANQYFGEEFDKKEVLKAYYISSGQIGLMHGLLNQEASHPLITAIDRARSIIAMDRYGRLASVDSIVKDKNSDPELVLDGMYRIFSALYQQNINSRDKDRLKQIAQRMSLVEAALNEYRDNVQAKLIFSNLFLAM